MKTKTIRDVTFDLLRQLELTTLFGNPGSTEETFLKNSLKIFVTFKHYTNHQRLVLPTAMLRRLENQLSSTSIPPQA